MKKLIFVFLLACALALCLSACTANSAQETIPAEGHESIGLAYTLSEDGTYYSVSGIGNCEDTDIVIPLMHNELPVKEIAYGAFGECSSLASVVIPDSVTSIGEYAFYACNSLTGVVIGDSVTSIGEYAFYGCHKLVEVINHSTLDIQAGTSDYGNIGYYAKEVHKGKSKIVNQNGYLFYTHQGVNYLLGYTGNETGLILPKNYKGKPYEIDQWAFSSCDSLTSVVIPDSVTSIGDWAFYNCDSLTSVVIGDSVTSIGDWAFTGCHKLVEVINHSTLNIRAGSSDYGDIGYYAKEVHKGESKIVNQNGYLFYTHQGVNYLLGYTGNETDLILPENDNGATYEIYQYAFYSCGSLTSVVIPDSVTSIGYGAFYGCRSLTSVVIPDSVTSIGGYAFIDCDSLTSVVIPDSVKSIGKYAFSGCHSLTSVVIGDSVTSIRERAFLDCGSLTGVVIPDSVTSIGDLAFYGCGSLTSVVIPDSVKSIGDAAFAYCGSLTSVVIPDSVTSIGYGAFSSCTGLKNIYYRGTASQWEAISKGSNWNSGTGSYTITYNYTGE